MNTATLIGYTGGESELRYTQSGQPVMNFSLATTERWKDESGAKHEKTEWHKIVMFGKRAEGLSKHITKGVHLCVVGQIQTQKWQDKQGNDRYTTQIKANNVEFLGGGNGRDRQADDQQQDAGHRNGSYDGGAHQVDDIDLIPF